MGMLQRWAEARTPSIAARQTQQTSLVLPLHRYAAEVGRGEDNTSRRKANSADFSCSTSTSLCCRGGPRRRQHQSPQGKLSRLFLFHLFIVMLQRWAEAKTTSVAASQTQQTFLVLPLHRH